MTIYIFKQKLYILKILAKFESKTWIYFKKRRRRRTRWKMCLWGLKRTFLDSLLLPAPGCPSAVWLSFLLRSQTSLVLGRDTGETQGYKYNSGTNAQQSGHLIRLYTLTTLLDQINHPREWSTQPPSAWAWSSCAPGREPRSTWLACP